MSSVLHLDRQLCFALHRAARAMTAAYQSELGELGLTYPQYLVMLSLWEEDGARVSRLGERLELDSATLTPLLKRMEGRGLVERRRSRDDERVVEVYLTPEGRKLRRRAERVPARMLTKMKTTGTSEAELARLHGDLRRLARALREDGEDGEDGKARG